MASYILYEAHSFTHPFHIIQQYGYACKELEKRQARSFQVFFMKRRDLHIKFEASCTHEHMLHSLSHENFNHFWRSRSGVHYDFQTRRYSFIYCESQSSNCMLMAYWCLSLTKVIFKVEI